MAVLRHNWQLAGTMRGAVSGLFAQVGSTCNCSTRSAFFHDSTLGFPPQIVVAG
jgi:hypothetical protein